jgi:hypothetical protein
MIGFLRKLLRRRDVPRLHDAETSGTWSDQHPDFRPIDPTEWVPLNAYTQIFLQMIPVAQAMCDELDRIDIDAIMDRAQTLTMETITRVNRGVIAYRQSIESPRRPDVTWQDDVSGDMLRTIKRTVSEASPDEEEFG